MANKVSPLLNKDIPYQYWIIMMTLLVLRGKTSKNVIIFWVKAPQGKSHKVYKDLIINIFLRSNFSPTSIKNPPFWFYFPNFLRKNLGYKMKAKGMNFFRGVGLKVKHKKALIIRSLWNFISKIFPWKILSKISKSSDPQKLKGCLLYYYFFCQHSSFLIKQTINKQQLKNNSVFLTKLHRI